MSVEEARQAVMNEVYRENTLGGRSVGLYLDRLIIEVQAAMPCCGRTGTGSEQRYCGVNDPTRKLPLCPSCRARETMEGAHE